ncbi:MAG TPA: HepT-like ribonuclease domain-containing protein [Streptosporangiaceae bacterium]|nr:HepT-like ribonuclease domain-containing protein [Streptosporangiaceae bacterium]
MRRDGERLADIIEAAEKISVRVGKGRRVFDADEDVQIVLVHLIQVIGEAASGLSDELISEHPEVPWRQIIAIRNRVVHGYFEVDLDILWDVADIDVPRLADQIRQIRSSMH